MCDCPKEAPVEKVLCTRLASEDAEKFALVCARAGQSISDLLRKLVHRHIDSFPADYFEGDE